MGPQNDHMDLFKKRYGSRFDAEEKARKKEARKVHEVSNQSQNLTGIKGKLHAKERYKEKAKMRKAIKAHEEKDAKVETPKQAQDGAIPAYLLDRNEVNRTKVLSNMIKQKRKEKAGKWKVPVEKVKALTEEEMFKVLKSGKRKQKAWKRMINKVTFVSKDFVRKPPKYERFIRPTGLRMKRAHVTHPELKTTFCLDILGVKKNPQSSGYT